MGELGKANRGRGYSDPLELGKGQIDGFSQIHFNFDSSSLVYIQTIILFDVFEKLQVVLKYSKLMDYIIFGTVM